MKKLLFTGLALVGLTANMFAQGTFALDNSSSGNGLASGTPGNWYSGTVGFEVWNVDGLSASAAAPMIAAINTAAAASGIAAYALLQSDGFSLVTSFPNRTITPANEGIFSLGTVTVAGQASPGSTELIALTAWNTSAASFAAAVAGGAPGTLAGVISFEQPTAFSSPPPAPSNLNWGLGAGTVNQDLVMTPVPEPTMFALAGLGAAALLIFRRRK